MSSEQTTSAPTIVPPAVMGSRLYQFSRSRLAQIPKEGLEENSTGAILACAFFLGAAEALDGENDQALPQTLAAHLDLSDRGSAHLIDTTRRLIRKYPFMDEIFAQGQQVAGTWQDAGAEEGVSLVGLLAKNRDLTLMELDIQGVSRDYAPGAQGATAEGRRRGRRPAGIIFLVLLLIALAAANYFMFFR